MLRRRFVPLLVLGLLFSIGLACAQIQQPEALAPAAVPAAESVPVVSLPAPPAVPLPAETAALVASLGPDGLFNPPRKDMRLVVISDLNSAYGSTNYDPEVDLGVQLAPFWQPDLVVCSGDMVAGQSPSLTASQIQAMWAAFDQHVAAPLRQANIPFGFTIGNHDASGARTASGQFAFQQERSLAAAYWNDPAHSPGLEFIDRSDFPFFYTFKLRDLFFLVWDGSTSQIPADKLAWVEQALASDAAQQAKMRVLVGHLPLYGISVGRDKPGEVMHNADQLRALLERYRVHTYISGHQHAYYPGHRGQLELLHAGLLGSGPRQLIDGSQPPGKTLTVVDVDFADPALTTYTTYDMQSLGLIDPAALPRFLIGHNGRVLRRDVAWQDLSAAEQDRCYQRLGAALCGAS